MRDLGRVDPVVEHDFGQVRELMPLREPKPEVVVLRAGEPRPISHPTLLTGRSRRGHHGGVDGCGCAGGGSARMPGSPVGWAAAVWWPVPASSITMRGAADERHGPARAPARYAAWRSSRPGRATSSRSSRATSGPRACSQARFGRRGEPDVGASEADAPGACASLPAQCPTRMSGVRSEEAWSTTTSLRGRRSVCAEDAVHRPGDEALTRRGRASRRRRWGRGWDALTAISARVAPGGHLVGSWR